MQTMRESSFNNLVARYLGDYIAQELAEAVHLSALPVYAQDFITRMLELMKRAGYTAREFNPALIQWISGTIPGMLPDSWGGEIPPITLPKRHLKLDDYVEKLSFPHDSAPPLFIDVGCGFPPLTAGDTARKFPDWEILGIDRSFADYVLYDKDGHYACFDRQGTFQYFQAFMNISGRKLYADTNAARERFIDLFAKLAPLLENNDDSASETVEKEGNKLIHNHIRDFESDNLTLRKSDIMTLECRQATVIRCMNLLVYFDIETRKKMLQKTQTLLQDDGIIIAGTNGFGIQTRYTVYRNGGHGLFPEAFAFTVDNLGHIVFMPWFSIIENEPEGLLLADLAGTIRANSSFWPEFSRRMDELLQDHGLCKRGNDGFLHFLQQDMQPAEYLERNSALWRQIETEGYPERIVEILTDAGYEAWKNPVGDIAVSPPAGFLDFV